MRALEEVKSVGDLKDNNDYCVVGKGELFQMLMLILRLSEFHTTFV